MTDTRGDRTAQALSAFLVDRAHLLLPLSAQLSETPTEVESAIRGSSMAPAIPPRSRLRCASAARSRARWATWCSISRTTATPSIASSTAPPEANIFLAEGDARFAPDPPLSCQQVLGTVVAVEIGGQWLPVEGPPARPWRQRIVRSMTLAAMIAATQLSAGAARRLAAILLTVETKGRMTRRRLLRGRGAPDPTGAARRGKGPA
jgi:hypothetical protein